MIDRDGDTITYNPLNKPAIMISKAGKEVRFYYGVGGARYQKHTDELDTYYIGKSYEERDDGNGNIEQIVYLSIGGQTIGIHTEKFNTGFDDPKELSTHYFHTDALGSITAITDEHAKVIERRSYTPFGKIRSMVYGTNIITASLLTSLETTRGFTGHEFIGELPGLVHMNARVYDSDLGRFLSADTMIPSPYHSQSYNRYSYLNNNPLGDTDSTGHAPDRQSAEEFISSAHAHNGATWTDSNNATHHVSTKAVKDADGNVGFAIADQITKSNGDKEMLVVHGSRPINGQTVMEATLYSIKDGASRPMMTTAYGAIGRNPNATASFENLFGKIAGVNSQTTHTGAGREIVSLSPVVGPALDARDAFKAGNIGMGLLFAAMAGLDVATAGVASKLGMLGKVATKSLHRPYIRKAVREEVKKRAEKTAAGLFIDPNTEKIITGKYDLGHKPGKEFWREKAEAKAKGISQKDFNDYMNNPDFYHIEDRFSNRSHRFEDKSPLNF